MKADRISVSGNIKRQNRSTDETLLTCSKSSAFLVTMQTVQRLHIFSSLRKGMFHTTFWSLEFLDDHIYLCALKQSQQCQSIPQNVLALVNFKYEIRLHPLGVLFENAKKIWYVLLPFLCPARLALCLFFQHFGQFVILGGGGTEVRQRCSVHQDFEVRS